MSIGTPAPAPSRVDWIDIARGGTILFVIFHHAMLSAVQIGPVEGHLKLLNFVIARDIRMPLFFFCSGILAFWGLQKPWHVVVGRRFLVLFWIIGIWTLLHMVVDHYVLLYPWGGQGYDLIKIFWAPFGNIWFVYAITIVTGVMFCLRRLSLSLQVVGVLLSVAALNILIVERVPGVDGESLIGLVARYALLCFAAGYWLAPATVRYFADPRRAIVALVAGSIVWLALKWSASAVLEDGPPKIVLAVPALAIGLGLARMLAELRWLATPLRYLGTRTLELFLLHQIFLAIGFAALQSLPGVSGTAALLCLTAFAVAGSLLTQRGIAEFDLQFLFRPPQIRRRPQIA